MPVMSKCNRFAIVALLGAALLPSVATAQESTTPHPLEPSDTSSPAATLNSLINSCNELHELIKAGPINDERASEILPTTERILDCLDLSELPKELRNTAGIESALYLKEVLDRIALPADEEIPSPLDSELPDSEPLLRWQIPRTRIAITRVDAGPQRNAYLFSPETVRSAAEFYRMVRTLPYRTDGRSVSAGLHDAYVAATKKQPSLTADTSSPRGTLTLFLDSCNEFHEAISKERYFDRSRLDYMPLAQRIISCLDTSQLPEYSREYFDAEAAVCLKEVLDRIPLPAAEAIPGMETLETSDGFEALVRWQVPRTQIVISKMQEGPRRGEFLFSAGTVSRAPELYNKIRSQPYRKEGRAVSEGLYNWWLSSPGNPMVAAWVDRLPGWIHQRGFGLAIWQWMGLVLAIPLSLAVMLLVFRVGRTQSEHVRQHSLLRVLVDFGVSVGRDSDSDRV